MHGPIAAIQPGWPVVVVVPSGPARPSVEEIVLPPHARGARLVAVSDVRAVLRRAQTKLVLASGVPEWLNPLTAVVPGRWRRCVSRACEGWTSTDRSASQGDPHSIRTRNAKRPRLVAAAASLPQIVADAVASGYCRA